jgi:hypothetical protein
MPAWHECLVPAGEYGKASTERSPPEPALQTKNSTRAGSISVLRGPVLKAKQRRTRFPADEMTRGLKV